jgi:hypothetical protein
MSLKEGITHSIFTRRIHLDDGHRGVDHKALVTILDTYTLDAVENPKLQRLKEWLSPYVFKTVWRKGREHAVPDALSRAPVNDPSTEDEAANSDVQSFATITRVRAITYSDTPV